MLFASTLMLKYVGFNKHASMINHAVIYSTGQDHDARSGRCELHHRRDRQHLQEARGQDGRARTFERAQTLITIGRVNSDRYSPFRYRYYYIHTRTHTHTQLFLLSKTRFLAIPLSFLDLLLWRPNYSAF